MQRYGLLLLVAAAACAPDDLMNAGAEQRAEAVTTQPEIVYWTHDDEMERVTREVAPGFAGFYQDGNLMIVNMAAGADPAPAIEYVRNRIHGVYEAPEEIAVRMVAHDYETLRMVERRLRPIFAEGLAVSLDIREELNVVELGVEPGLISTVTEMVQQLELPDESVLIEPSEEGVFQSTLRDTQRPVSAGPQIQDYNDGTCTLGVLAYNGANAVFIIASHCSGNSFSLDTGANAQLYQATAGSSTRLIGNEIDDRTEYLCTSGLTCRRSDNAIIDANTNSSSLFSYGQIARTTTRVKATDSGTWTIDAVNPYFVIASRDESVLWVGASIDRIGMTGGWTTTSVKSLCSTRNFEGYDLYCLGRTELSGVPGDSGGPYFKLRQPTTNIPTEVTFLGTYVGVGDTDGFWSQLDGMEYDFGTTFKVCPAC